MKKRLIVALLAAVAAGVGWILYSGYWLATEISESERDTPPAPVEVAPIEQGTIVFNRTFSGTLEATAAFQVSPKISGRVERMAVDLADAVERGQTVVELDDQEYVQAVSQAEADQAVARANLAEAQSALEIANRELGRIETLRTRGVASESQYDVAMTAQLAAQARLEVARAQLQRSGSSLESARIRLDYTKVNAEWSGGSDRRVVAERFVDVGDTVSANTPLLSIVELSPITGAIFVTERDYARIAENQAATLSTDAFPGETFEARVARISPVFRQESRQARVELAVDNPGEHLKPGMFIRVTIELAREEEATLVPEAALTSRSDTDGVFVLSADGGSVVWRPVTAGLREGDRVQISGEGLQGHVVTLGQQLLDDGSPVTIPDADTPEIGG